MKQAHETAAG